MSARDIDRLVQIVVAHPEGPGLESTAETIVRLILGALREPSEEMLEAMIASLGSDDDRSAPEVALDCWLAAIKASSAMPAEGQVPGSAKEK